MCARVHRTAMPNVSAEIDRGQNVTSRDETSQDIHCRSPQHLPVKGQRNLGNMADEEV